MKKTTRTVPKRKTQKTYYLVTPKQGSAFVEPCITYKVEDGHHCFCESNGKWRKFPISEITSVEISKEDYTKIHLT